MKNKVVLTGDRPTGPLHLGHYVGSLKNRVRLQNEGYETFILIADIQALTTHVDEPELIEESVQELVLDYISVGLDPDLDHVHFVLQSKLPELSELTSLFSMITSYADVKRNPTVKSEMKKIEDDPQASVTAGFVMYPVSQTADILGFTPEKGEEAELVVPVGEDQLPHIELAREVARRFNGRYQDLFVEPGSVTSDFGRLPGTDGAEKMSKSVGNVIQLKDSSKEVNEAVEDMYTDSQKIHKDDPGRPEQCPVHLYEKALGLDEAEKIESRAEACRNGELGCVEHKKIVKESLNEFLEPIRNRREKAENRDLGNILKKGSKYARQVVQANVRRAERSMHLDYPTIFNE